MAAANRKGKAPIVPLPDFFDKKWNSICTNHSSPVKHLMKDYHLLQRFINRLAKKGAMGKASDPNHGDGSNNDDHDNHIPLEKGCLVIIIGPEARGSKRSAKLARRKVYAAKPATPTYL